jgi:hypothetical protein
LLKQSRQVRFAMVARATTPGRDARDTFDRLAAEWRRIGIGANPIDENAGAHIQG